MRRIILSLLVAVSLSGCIRLSAGTWHKSASDKSVTTRTAALDTRELLPGQNTPKFVDAS